MFMWNIVSATCAYVGIDCVLFILHKVHYWTCEFQHQTRTKQDKQHTEKWGRKMRNYSGYEGSITTVYIGSLYFYLFTGKNYCSMKNGHNNRPD